MRNTVLGAAAMLLSGLGGGSALAQDAPRMEFVLEELVTLGPDVTPGRTSRGERNMIPITGGTFEGPGIKGTVMPGGWDWQLSRADGCRELHADYMLRTDDGAVINVINDAVLCPPREGEPARAAYTSPRFEAPTGKYAWLNHTTFVGTVEPATGPNGERAVKIRFYKAV